MIVINYKTEEDRDKDLEEFNNANSEKHLKFKKDIISIRTVEGDD